MRGKFLHGQQSGGPRKIASMRPAHYAREVKEQREASIRALNASMRPAHYAREVGGAARGPRIGVPASMRPAHYAREVPPPPATPPSRRPGFNEARALCAGSSTPSSHPAESSPRLQ